MHPQKVTVWCRFWATIDRCSKGEHNTGHRSNSAGSMRKSHWKLDHSDTFHRKKPRRALCPHRLLTVERIQVVQFSMTLPRKIIFSDKAHFWMNGCVNKQNCRIWDDTNPHEAHKVIMHPQKVTVWCRFWATIDRCSKGEHNTGHRSHSAGSMRKSHWKLDHSDTFHRKKPRRAFEWCHIAHLMAYMRLSNKKNYFVNTSHTVCFIPFQHLPALIENPLL